MSTGWLDSKQPMGNQWEKKKKQLAALPTIGEHATGTLQVESVICFSSATFKITCILNIKISVLKNDALVSVQTHLHICM